MKRRLRHRQIEAFAAVMQTGSIVAAAAQIHISQPSVSRLIQDLQAELGFELFHKRGRGVAPTAAARALYAEVERSFSGLDRITAVARRIGSGFGDAVAFGSIYAAAFDLTHAAMAQLKDEVPSASASLRVQTTATLIDWTRRGIVDLALVNPLGDLRDVEVVVERELACVCLLPRGHPLAADGKAIDLQRLFDETLILPDEATLTALIPDSEVRNQLQERAWLNVQIWFAVATAVEHGLGIGLADPISASFFARNRRVVSRPLRQRLPYRLALIRQPASSQSDLAATLAQILRSLLEKR